MTTIKGESGFTQLSKLNISEKLLVKGVQVSVFENAVVITQASDLSGTVSNGNPLLSTVEYFIDGVIDMGSQSIEIPQGGLNLSGYNFDVSKLISSEDDYTMFTSPGTGSGNILGTNYAIEVTGSNSQVYDIVSDTGLEAFEFSKINYNNCTSLGEIDSYRQGFESGTGRFGGTPNLTLTGTWLGGYFIDSSIVRSLDASMSGGLFQAGAGFIMTSRFRSNQNIDLPANVSFFDFSPGNFINPSTVQIVGAIISRNGVFDATDPNLTPNMSSFDLVSAWSENVGLANTFTGGDSLVAVEVTTIIGATSTFVDLAGTWVASDLQHFDSPANGQLRHLGGSPREYKVTATLTIDGNANDEISIKVRKWDNSAGSFVDVITQTRPINSLAGIRDVAFFTVIAHVILDPNDYVILQVANNTAVRNVTADLDSFYLVERR